VYALYGEIRPESGQILGFMVSSWSRLDRHFGVSADPTFNDLSDLGVFTRGAERHLESVAISDSVSEAVLGA